MNNDAKDPTGTAMRFVPFTEVHAQMEERAEWAKLCMPGLWDRFITILESKAFTLDEITREHRRIKNLYGSVEEHRKAFMRAAEDVFDLDLSSERK